LSRVVIIGAVLLFIAGVSLLVYFYRRYQRIEKEPEEDWDFSRRSLFVNAQGSPKLDQTTDKSTVQVTPASVIGPVEAGGTRELASEHDSPSSTAEPIASPQRVEAPAPPSTP